MVVELTDQTDQVLMVARTLFAGPSHLIRPGTECESVLQCDRDPFANQRAGCVQPRRGTGRYMRMRRQPAVDLPNVAAPQTPGMPRVVTNRRCGCRRSARARAAWRWRCR